MRCACGALCSSGALCSHGHPNLLAPVHCALCFQRTGDSERREARVVLLASGLASSGSELLWVLSDVRGLGGTDDEEEEERRAQQERAWAHPGRALRQLRALRPQGQGNQAIPGACRVDMPRLAEPQSPWVATLRAGRWWNAGYCGWHHFEDAAG